MEVWNYQRFLDGLDETSYRPCTHTGLDIWQMRGRTEPDVKTQEVDSATLDNWLDREDSCNLELPPAGHGEHEPTDILWRFRLLYCQRPESDPGSSTIWWSRSDFEKIVARLHFSQQLPSVIDADHGVFAEFKSHGLQSQRTLNSGYVFSSKDALPCWSGCSTYNLSTRTTTALLQYTSSDQFPVTALRDYLRYSAAPILHPLAFPVFLLEIRQAERSDNCTRQHRDLVTLERSTGFHVFNSKAPPPDPLKLDFDHLTHGLNKVGATSHCHIAVLRGYIKQLEQIQKINLRDRLSLDPSLLSPSLTLERRISYLLASYQGVLDTLSMLLGRVQIQLSIVYNYSVLRDNDLNLKIAKDSRSVALASKRDSTSLNAIGVLTMLFLPGTFFSTFLAIPFFANKDWFKKLSHAWLIPAVAIPLLVILFASWIIWARKKAEDNQRQDARDASDLNV